MIPMPRCVRLAALAATAALCAAACAADDGAGETSTLTVATAFYPLQYVVQRVGGDAVDVTSLTPPGAEPHDLELAPQDLARLQDADLVVYLSGFQPAVDEAVGQDLGPVVLDTADSADLTLTFTALEEGEAQTDEAGSTDPHFWLDPQRLAAVAGSVQEALAAADPGHAATFERNLATLRADLDELDARLHRGLADCEVTDLVTSHNAFGYLAQRYGLKQVGIAGLSPESEPSPQQLADVAALVERDGVRTIYSETLMSPAIAQTVADETGAQTAVLDPIEGITDSSAGDDYLEIMRANLATLREGQQCR